MWMNLSLLKMSLLLASLDSVDKNGKKSHILYINYFFIKNLEEHEERVAQDKLSESSQTV